MSVKYRRLSSEEMNLLEDKFIKYLSANSIPADDWEKMKKENPEQVNLLLDDFSDLVVGTTLKNLKYLIMISPKDIKAFHCEQDKVTLNGISVIEGKNVSFNENDDRGMFMTIAENLDSFEVYQYEKTYEGEREEEIFDLIENGCKIIDERLFNMLESLMEDDE